MNNITRKTKDTLIRELRESKQETESMRQMYSKVVDDNVDLSNRIELRDIFNKRLLNTIGNLIVENSIYKRSHKRYNIVKKIFSGIAYSIVILLTVKFLLWLYLWVYIILGIISLFAVTILFLVLLAYRMRLWRL